MTSASKTSNRRPYKVFPLWEASEQAEKLSGEELDRFWRDQSAPPDVRGRKREARRWLDMLTVLSTDPGVSERHPSDGWLTFEEKKFIWYAARVQLREIDPELYRAVMRVEWDDRIRDRGITVKEWQIRIARRWPLLKRLRAGLREAQPGPRPLIWEQVSAILRVRPTAFFSPLAEVAERQTR
jgi:hypothetical protein